MSHEFELHHEIDLAATPEQVWEAIATGPGIDSWLMGSNTVEPREGGTASMSMPGFTAESTVTTWDPPNAFGIRSEPDEEGAFMAFEYLIEGRSGGSTVLRLVHSGVMGGNDWESEYDALKKGNPMYLRTLATYLEHFGGRTAVPVAAFGPPQANQDVVWDGLKRALGLTGTVTEGDKVAYVDADGTEVNGIVDSALEPNFLGVRTEDALLRFVGRGGMVLTGHHLFGAVDRQEAEEFWGSWLAKTLA